MVGRSIKINDTQFTVAGVMPASFYGVELNEQPPDMWLPVTMQREVMMQPSLLDPHGLFWLHMMGRGNAGVSLKAAQAWVTAQLQQFMIDREGAQISAARRLGYRRSTSSCCLVRAAFPICASNIPHPCAS